MKENITKFDLEDAFKALDELDVPTPKRGIKANRLNLKETLSKKPQTDSLLEDYYDVSDKNELEDAKEERDAEVAKAKLARIEKIVDLNAESPEDLLPSYVGKVIIQCPQCLTLFYKDENDIVKSEDDENIANVDEKCQHCGNDSGYTIIGKVAGIEADEAAKFGVEEEEPTFEEEEEVEVKEEEPAEENAEEESQAEGGEEAPVEEEEIDLDALTKAALEGGEEEEKKEESFAPIAGSDLLIEAVEEDLDEDEAIEETVDEVEEVTDETIEEEPVFTKEEVKEIATDVADTVSAPVKSEDEADEQAAEIEEIVDAKVEEAAEEKAEEAEEVEEVAEEIPAEEEIEEEKEVLTEDVGLDILDSPRYKTHIEDSAIDAYLSEVKSRKAGKSNPKFEELEVDIDDVDEKSFEECLNKALKDVYENVKSFKLTECKFKKDTNQLILEGIVNFNSGKQRTGRYTFNKCIIKENNKVKLVGNSNLFEGINKCVLLGTLDTANCLTTNIISYKGHIGKDLIEGYASASKEKLN